MALRNSDVIIKLRSLALQGSARAGVQSPATMHAVMASDHQAAQELLSGSIVDDHKPVYVIEMTGGPFRATHHPTRCRRAAGERHERHRGPQTFRVTDVGIHPAAHDLTKIDLDVVDLLAN